ncbi:restriction endonuclease subunit R [Metamycoplasma auris]|uniref:Uncharacterized protein n=1 Tax=Metamycoplasma auris TaxID=51363 RepID=A0A2W7G568_9BACT|nr:restriction endonuclease subunit R [Metamycoplasma auris]PZV98737.1 hypothetical protein BCF89_1115 [Metamycoplasma auris]
MHKLNLLNIDPYKKCIKFLQERVLSNSYRGMQISQHNRYDLDVVITLLKTLYDICGENKLEIRTTDLSKRPENTENEFKYAEYVNKINKVNKYGTQDSVRKNLFVDLHRMNLINRFNGDILLDPHKRANKVTSVSITKTGLELINQQDILGRWMTYSGCIDLLTDGLVLKLHSMILDNDLKYYITVDEFMFFVTFLNKELNGEVFDEEKIQEFIKEYRTLPISNREEIKKRIKEYANPEKFGGNKTTKRDYNNWKNETQQIITILDQTSFFEYDSQKERLQCRLNGPETIFTNDNLLKVKRSSIQKSEYFKQHNVIKKEGYHLHHIVPLFRSTSVDHFVLIDRWENLLYIDAKKHDIITRRRSLIQLEILENEDIRLKDFSSDIYLKKDDNVFYSSTLSSKMLEKNKELLKTL